MTAITETDVVLACQTLFGTHVNISRDFLSYLQPSGAKSAYRKKAKENHPDLFAADPVHVQQKQTALFREILHAYDVINLFFKQRDQGAWKPAAQRVQRSQWHSTDAAKTAQQTRTTQAPRNDTHYRGVVPHRTLQIGQYLYYRGKISFAQLIDALIWQRKQRPSVGDIALRWGWLDRERLEIISRACDRPRRFGEKAVELGILTVFQVNAILLYQRAQQTRLGDYFVTNNILRREHVDQIVRELHEHNARMLAGSAQRTSRSRPVYT